LNWPDPDSSAGPLGDGRLATAVERPTSLNELRDCVRRRVAEGLAIYPQGGRTALDYGGIPRRPGAAVDLNGLNRVIDYPAADMTITVEAGITLAALARVLDTEGQRLCIDAPQPDRATIGGVFATNSTGPRRFGWGRPRDQIIGVGFVTADANVIKGGGRVVKNVAGYDFPRLLTGSMGTLGIISNVTLRVRPRPEAIAVVQVTADDLRVVAQDLERLNTSSTRPVAIELLNRPASNLVSRGIASEAWSLEIAYEGNEEEVSWQVERLRAELASQVGLVRKADNASAVVASLRELASDSETAVQVVANVRASTVPSLAAAVDPGRWGLLAHAGNGVVRLFSLDHDLGAIEADVHRLRALAEADGGNLIIARCPPERKESLKVWGNPRPDWGWNERVKAALDPDGVMNPGRFVGTI
jgi:glycolate oxidase FAD binding subunit